MNHWSPNSGADTARARARMLASARRYFEQTQVLAVDTPALSRSTATDPQITSLRTAGGGFLQTSPESHMKRLLAAGYPDIYTVCRAFRGDESGRRHLPEFTLIEWYRRDMGLAEIIGDTCALIAAVLERGELETPTQVYDYVEMFLEHAGIDPLHASIDDLAECAHADDDLRQVVQDDRDGWLDLILSLCVAPSFATDSLTIVRHYPASQAALARLCPVNDQFADRFEVFYGTIEIANGYVELTDADELSRRMDADLCTRNAQGKIAVAKDVCLLAAMEAGLPACAGVALGFERLHMIADGSDDIRNVVTFSDYEER